MNLYHLRYFLEAARELNFARAARNLYISPPAMSRSIDLLERSLKKKLFVRTKRHVALNTDGEFLKGRAEKIYDEIEGARIELEGASLSPAMLRIGCREMITHYLLPRPLLEFKKRHPQTKFGIHELEPARMADALKKDQLDFGFYYADIEDPGLESRHLGRLRSHIYASKNLAKIPLKKIPFIAPRYFQAPSGPGADGYPDQRHPRNIQYEGEFLETHRRFVLEGLAAAVLPDLVIPDWRKQDLVQIPGPAIFREIYFFKRRLRPLPKAVEYFCDLIRNKISTPLNL